MFLPIFIGGSVATITYIIFFSAFANSLRSLLTLLTWSIPDPRYVAAHHRYSSMTPPRPVPPEVRLEMAVFGGPMLVIALFWFGWTSYPSISWWSPALAGGLIGWATIVRRPAPLSLENLSLITFRAAVSIVRPISSDRFAIETSDVFPLTLSIHLSTSLRKYQPCHVQLFVLAFFLSYLRSGAER